MASFDKLPSGRFRARVYLGRKTNGSLIYKTLTDDRQSNLKVAVAELERELRDGDMSHELSHVSFEVAAKEWMQSKRTAVRPRTARDYARYIERVFIPKWGTIRTDNITERMVREWLTTRIEQSSTNTARKQFLVLRQMMASIMKGRSPCRNIPLPVNVSFFAEPPTTEDKKRILAVVTGTPYELPLRLIADGGIRVGEICAMEYGALLSTKGRLHIRKGMALTEDGYKEDQTKSRRSHRQIAITQRIQELAWFNLEAKGVDTKNRTLISDEYVNQYAVNIRPDSLNQAFRHIMGRHNSAYDKDGRPLDPTKTTFRYARVTYHLTGSPVPLCRLYDLRHYHASWLLRQGIPDKAAADRLGHDVTVLHKTYQHLLVEHKEEVDDVIIALQDADDKSFN